MHPWEKEKDVLESWGPDNSKKALTFLNQLYKAWDIKDLFLRKFSKFRNMFYFVFIRFVNRAVVKDKIWWYHWISHWILCRKLYKNIFLAEKTNQVISIFLTDINTKTPKKRPHTQLFDVDVSREKGHNSVIFSVRNKFLSCSEFNEKFSSTIRFYVSLLFFEYFKERFWTKTCHSKVVNFGKKC